jgi:ABC-2 type transport system permease protein
MASGNELILNTETGWRRGFRQLLDRENGNWWKTSRWLRQAIIYLFVLNGILLAGLNAPGGEGTPDALTIAEKVAQGAEIFITLAGIMGVISVVIIGQDAIIGEKQSGTAAWILSKPVSRPAFLLSKLAAISVGFFATIIVMQGVVAYLILSITNGSPIPAAGFISAMLVVFLDLLFYITLTLMLGVLFEQRGGVIGIGLALALGYQLIIGVAPFLMQVMPWGLVASGPQGPSVAAALAAGQAPASLLPVFATLAWCVLFVGVALWRFNKAEF